MNSILTKVQLFLAEANKASVSISEEIIEEFGNACKDAFRKQFTEKRQKEFSYRMSNIGKPLCQLQMEKSGAEQEPLPYNFKMRNLFGDLIEASAIAIMKASDIDVQDIQKKVKLKVKYGILNRPLRGLLRTNLEIMGVLIRSLKTTLLAMLVKGICMARLIKVTSQDGLLLINPQENGVSRKPQNKKQITKMMR